MIFFQPTITTTKLESDYPLLYTILQKVSEECEINSAMMLLYLKKKKCGNSMFHLNVDITKYAYEHQSYDLNKFLRVLNRYLLDETEFIIFQLVLINICRK